MSGLYLITGFLGAGKTSFLKHFLRLFAGQKMQIIVNEFGKEGVDGTLLSGMSTDLREISGGSVFCSCRMDQFEQVLQESAGEKPDVIITEASGLSDPTGVRRLFDQTVRFPHIQYKGAICLVDAVRFPKLYDTARACTRQLAASDIAVVNKTDLAGDDQLRQTRRLIQEQRPDLPILETSFGRIPPDFLEKLSAAQNGDKNGNLLIEDLTVGRITLRIAESIRAYELEMFIRMFAEQTFRIKGFISTRDLGMVLVDGVGTTISLAPYSEKVPPEKQGILNVLYGAGMRIRPAVAQACKWYDSFILSKE
ncbi:MAG: CobW family GTP-binding protein [Candidatus Heritagella sp.]